MKIAFAMLLVLHGAIHLLGAARAFGWAEVAQLPLQISTRAGAAWLAASMLFVATAVMLFLSLRLWWLAGLEGAILS